MQSGPWSILKDSVSKGLDCQGPENSLTVFKTQTLLKVYLFWFIQVSPPYDRNGTTALTAANLLFEMLCVMPGAKYYD